MCGGPVPRRASGDGRFPAPSRGSEPCRTTSCRRGGTRRTARSSTANNRIVPDDYPHLISTEWLNPYRAQRIADLLAGRARHTPADMASHPDRRLLPAADAAARPGRAIRRPPTRSSVARSACSPAGTARWPPSRPVQPSPATLMRHVTLEAYAETGRELERFLGAEGFSLLSPLLEFFGRTVPGTLDALERARRRLLPRRPHLARRDRQVPDAHLRRARAPPRARSRGAGRGVTVHVLALDHPLAALPGLRAHLPARAASRCRARPTPCGRPRTRSPTPSPARRRAAPACGSWRTSPTRTRRR